IGDGAGIVIMGGDTLGVAQILQTAEDVVVVALGGRVDGRGIGEVRLRGLGHAPQGVVLGVLVDALAAEAIGLGAHDAAELVVAGHVAGRAFLVHMHGVLAVSTAIGGRADAVRGLVGDVLGLLAAHVHLDLAAESVVSIRGTQVIRSYYR